MTTTVSTALRRFVGVAVDPQTYRNVTYLLLAFPLGVLYFTVLWGGGVAGVALLPLFLLGVPILVGVLAVAAQLATLETRLAHGLLDSDVGYERPEPSDGDVVEYMKGIATDIRSYSALGYLLSKFLIGTVAFTLLTTAAVLSVALTFAPVLYDVPGVHYDFGVLTVESFPVALGLSGVGVLVALLSLHACNLAARALDEYAKLMLGSERAN
ncbi:sensor domain-containing protein [Halosimplex litoreum]|uniref:Sensor domain-containing protein n=1 Tax=Halosimplex litoreum TaxID=1198301 RepID=A0A7T3FZ43_9EURY|nr:sensor domain-containing protein [Halosimplex litoreum]QPV63296.1 sensor domain-containing protein [Halosimplex litoreum]